MAGEDKPYIRWLHGRPCACHPCAAAPHFIQAHHPRGGAPSGRPGMSQRSPDRDAFKAEAHRLAHKKLRDPKFYTARTKRAVNSLTVERGAKGGTA